MPSHELWIPGRGGAGANLPEVTQAIKMEEQFEHLKKRGEDYVIIQVIYRISPSPSSAPSLAPFFSPSHCLSFHCIFTNSLTNLVHEYPLHVIFTPPPNSQPSVRPSSSSSSSNASTSSASSSSASSASASASAGPRVTRSVHTHSKSVSSTANYRFILSMNLDLFPWLVSSHLCFDLPLRYFVSFVIVLNHPKNR